MKTYQLYIKSHTVQPDYEDEYEGDSFEEALDHFMGTLGNNGWEADDIRRRIHCEDECPSCHADLVVKLEARERGRFEEVAYCYGCGTTEIREGGV